MSNERGLAELELLKEIESTDEMAFPPTAAVNSREEVVGTVTNLMIRKIYALRSFYDRQRSQLALDAKFATNPTDEYNAQYSALEANDKWECLDKLLWLHVKMQLSRDAVQVWHPTDCDWFTGIREGWKIVRYKDTRKAFSRGLLDLLGGL